MTIPCPSGRKHYFLSLNCCLFSVDHLCFFFAGCLRKGGPLAYLMARMPGCPTFRSDIVIETLRVFKGSQGTGNLISEEFKGNFCL